MQHRYELFNGALPFASFTLQSAAISFARGYFGQRKLPWHIVDNRKGIIVERFVP